MIPELPTGGEPGRMSIEQTAEIRQRFGYRALIVVGVCGDGTVDVMSHAGTIADSAIIGDYAQRQWGDHIPRAPFQTWFGWGNGGLGRALSAEQLAQLSEASRRYAIAVTDPFGDGAEDAI